MRFVQLKKTIRKQEIGYKVLTSRNDIKEKNVYERGRKNARVSYVRNIEGRRKPNKKVIFHWENATDWLKKTLSWNWLTFRVFSFPLFRRKYARKMKSPESCGEDFFFYLITDGIYEYKTPRRDDDEKRKGIEIRTFLRESSSVTKEEWYSDDRFFLFSFFIEMAMGNRCIRKEI